MHRNTFTHKFCTGRLICFSASDMVPSWRANGFIAFSVLSNLLFGNSTWRSRGKLTVAPDVPRSGGIMFSFFAQTVSSGLEISLLTCTRLPRHSTHQNSLRFNLTQMGCNNFLFRYWIHWMVYGISGEQLAIEPERRPVVLTILCTARDDWLLREVRSSISWGTRY